MRRARAGETSRSQLPRVARHVAETLLIANPLLGGCVAWTSAEVSRVPRIATFRAGLVRPVALVVTGSG